MNTRVWITGVNGFTGSHFVSFLRQRTQDIEIVGLDIASSTQLDVDRYECADLTDAESVGRVANEYPPTHVLHCAAVVFARDPKLLWDVNVRATANLIFGLRNAGLTGVRVVSIGSAAEYGPGVGQPFSESALVAPISEYGRSKLAQSMMALSLGLVSEQKVIVARTFNLIGPGISTNLVPGSLLERVMNCASGEISVFDSRSSRDFVDVRDAVAAYWQLLCEGQPDNIYNVCRGQGTTIAELAESFAKAFAGEVKLSMDESTEPTRIIGVGQKLQGDTGWTPSRSVDESVADMISAARG